MICSVCDHNTVTNPLSVDICDVCDQDFKDVSRWGAEAYAEEDEN